MRTEVRRGMPRPAWVVEDRPRQRDRVGVAGIPVDAIRAVKPDVVQLGQRWAELTQSSEGVEVQFEGGRTAKAGLVIGADGIHSKVSRALFGKDSPQFTGCVAWRGLVPMHRFPHHLARNTATSWLGPAGHVLHYPVRRGELMNFIAFVERTDWRVESCTVAGTIAELANNFLGWHADVHHIIRHIDVPYKWAFWVRPPMERWSLGRVTGARRCVPSNAAVPRPGIPGC
jgi:salicylate hydroxylase